MSIADTSPTELLSRAAEGDEEAWRRLVAGFGPLIWRVAKSFRLDDATASDVCQTVWVRLIESMTQIREPSKVRAWLVTTCRRESLRARTLQTRPHPYRTDMPSFDGEVELGLIEDEDRKLTARALLTLDERCRQVLRLLTTEPPLTYREVAKATGLAVGSVGPTRQRCLRQLRVAMEAAG